MPQPDQPDNDSSSATRVMFALYALFIVGGTAFSVTVGLTH